MTLFDQTIQAILENINLAAMGPKTGEPQSNNATSFTPNKTGPAVKAPTTVFPTTNKIKAATPGQANNVVPLLQPDGKTPFTNPKTGEPLSYDPQIFKDNPKQAFMDFDKNTKDYNFTPDQKAYIQTAIINSIQQ